MTREANSSLPLKETQRVKTLRSPWIRESQGKSVFDNAALVWRGYLWNSITFNLNQRVWSLLNACILLCLPLCNPMDCSPPGSSVHGIFQAKTLGWAAIFLLLGIFPTQGSSTCLLHLLHWQAHSLPLSHPASRMVATECSYLRSNSITAARRNENDAICNFESYPEGNRWCNKPFSEEKMEPFK